MPLALLSSPLSCRPVREFDERHNDAGVVRILDRRIGLTAGSLDWLLLQRSPCLSLCLPLGAVIAKPAGLGCKPFVWGTSRAGDLATAAAGALQTGAKLVTAVLAHETLQTRLPRSPFLELPTVLLGLPS